MKENINMINRFKWSLNPKKYSYLVKDKLGKAFLYLFILAIIFGIFQGITLVKTIGVVEKVVSKAYQDGKLNFEMKSGLLDFKSQPYKEEQGSVLLLVDTDKTIDNVDSLRNITVHKDLSTVILKDGIVIKNGSKEISYKYSDFGLDRVDFSSDLIHLFIEELGVIKYFMIPIIIIIKFIDMLYYALMMSLAGLISMLLNKQRLSYGNIYKLSMYSITAPTVLGLILPLGKYTLFIGGLILIFGINFVMYDDIIKINKSNI
jgi:hypothetical protein